MEVLETLDGRLSVRHEGRIIAAQEAPPSPVFLRNRHERSAPSPVAPSGAHGLGDRWTATLEPLDSRAEEEQDQGAITGSAAPQPASPKPPLHASRRSCRGRDGRRFRKPGATACRSGQSGGSWEFTEARLRNIWAPWALRRGSPGCVPRRHNLIPSQPRRVTFMLNSDTTVVRFAAALDTTAPARFCFVLAASLALRNHFHKVRARLGRYCCLKAK